MPSDHAGSIIKLQISTCTIIKLMVLLTERLSADLKDYGQLRLKPHSYCRRVCQDLQSGYIDRYTRGLDTSPCPTSGRETKNWRARGNDSRAERACHKYITSCNLDLCHVRCFGSKISCVKLGCNKIFLFFFC